MSKKALKLGAASILALGAGAAVVSKRTKGMNRGKQLKTFRKEHKRSFAILKEGNILRIVREYTILMVIMKHLQDRKNRKELMINQLIL